MESCLRLVAGILHRLLQRRRRPHPDGPVFEVSQERGVHAGAVIVDDRCRRRDGAGSRRAGREKRQGRRKKEKPDPVVVVPVEDLRQDRKRRIVDDDAALRVFFLLIISAGIEGPDHLRPLHAVLVFHPAGDGLIDQIRRVAVVRRFLCFELVQKFVIFFVSFLPAVVQALVLLEPAVGHLIHPEAEVRHVVGRQVLDLQRQQVQIPARQLRRLVMRQRVGPPLLVGQIVEPDARDGLHSQLSGCHNAAVALDYDIIRTPDADRIPEAESLYALRDRSHVQRLVLPGVFLVRF